MADPELQAHLAKLIQPDPTEVRRAKRAVMRRFEDAAAHATADVAKTAAEDLGAPREMALKLALSGPIDPTAIQADDTVLSFIRRRLAARRAIADLAVHQLLMPAIGHPSTESTDDPLARSPLSIEIIHDGRQHHGIDLPIPQPFLALAYMPSTLAEAPPKWFLDPDIFLADLTALPLDDRAQRTLREALAAFRRGLYLASLALLGVVSEATWYAAARKLGNPGSALDRAVGDGATAKVQKGVADILRAVPDLGTSVDDVYALAAFFRELRNYGVHAAPVRDDLDRFFSEEECGLLILRTHHYLVRLSEMVELAARHRSSAG